MSRKRAVLVAVLLALLGSPLMAVVGHRAYQRYLQAEHCKELLLEVRSAISAYYAYKASPCARGPLFPTIEELEAGGVVLEGRLPDNPFSTADVKNRVVVGKNPGHSWDYSSELDQFVNTPLTPRPASPGTTGGWRYDPDDGVFWPDTSSGRGESNW